MKIIIHLALCVLFTILTFYHTLIVLFRKEDNKMLKEKDKKGAENGKYREEE